MLLLVPLGNTSFLGYPMVSAFFNDTVLAYAIFYDQLGSFMALSIYGSVILALFSHDGAEGSVPSVSKIITKILTFPPLISLLIALFIPLEGIINQVDWLLQYLAATLVPLALFTLGLQFQPVLVSEQVMPLGASLFLKMCLAPILVYLVISPWLLPKEVIQASVFESAMPSMITPGILAMQAGLAPRFCATLLGYSTLLSMLSLPVVAYFLKAVV